MRVLVATRNYDKFGIVRRMVECVVTDAHLQALSDTNIPGDVVEVGSIVERAAQKAEYFQDRLEHSGRSDEFDAVLAIDDGLRVGEDEPTPNSKELTDKILRGEWPKGTPITVVRAFALIRSGERVRTEVTEVPFDFLGNPSGVTREKGRYPLSQVLAPRGMDVSVSALPREIEDRFNLSHSTEAIKRLFL